MEIRKEFPDPEVYVMHGNGNGRKDNPLDTMKTIETRRLKLRMVNVHDAKDFQKIFGDEESIRWFLGEDFHGLNDVREYLKDDVDGMFSSMGKYRAYAITLGCSGEVIGYIQSQTRSCSFVNFAKVGYVLGKDSRGKGYAAEALKALMAFLFDEQDVAWVEASVSEENVPSLSLLSRCGFHTPEWGETIDDWDLRTQTFMIDLTFTREDFSRGLRKGRRGGAYDACRPRAAA